MSFLNMSAAMSGMTAGFLRMHVSADNLARRNVVNSEKRRVVEEAVPTGGVRSTTETIPLDPALRSENPVSLEMDSADATNIDMAEELIQQIIARVTVGANMAVTRAGIDLERRVLDITA